MQSVFAVIKMAWGFFSDVTCPFLGISFASLFLGVMIVNFSIKLLRPLLGIGGSFAKAGERGLSRARSRKSRATDKKE